MTEWGPSFSLPSQVNIQLGHKGTGGSALPDCSQVDLSFVPSSSSPPSIPIEDGPIDIKYEAGVCLRGTLHRCDLWTVLYQRLPMLEVK